MPPTREIIQGLIGLQRREWITLALLFAVGLALGWLDAFATIFDG
jgi:hypothetical protein